MANITELIDKKTLKNLEQFEKSVEGIASGLEGVFNASQKAAKGLKDIDASSLEDVAKAQEDAIKNAKELEKQQKEQQKAVESLEKQRQKAYTKIFNDEAKARKKIADDEKKAAESLEKQRQKALSKQVTDQKSASDALEKQRQKAINQMAKQEHARKEQIALLEKEATTRGELIAQNKALSHAINDVNLKQEGGIEKVAEMNAQIDKNNELIKANSSELTQQKMGIGGYQDAIESAFTSLKEGESAGDVFTGLSEGIKGATKSSLAFIATPLGAIIAALAVAVGLVVAAFKRFEPLMDRLKTLTGGLSAAFQAAIGWMTGYEVSMKDAFETGQKLVKMQIELEKSTIAVTRNQADLNQLFERYNNIADDATLSFAKREQASKAAAAAAETSARLELVLSKQSLDILALKIDQEKAVGTATRERLQELADAEADFTSKQTDLNNVLFQDEKRLRELKQDRLERDLDIALDSFDNQKTINEQIINNEETTHAERQRLLLETRMLGIESFASQQESLQQFTDVQIDFNKILKLNNKDAIEYIRTLELSEIIEGRILEVVRDRRSAARDLDQAQQDLTKSIKEFNVETLKILEETEDALFEELEKEEDELLQKYVEKEEEKRKVAKETADARIEQEKRVSEASQELAVSSINAIFGYNSAANQRELEGLQAQKEAQTITEEQYQEKIKAIKTKQARRDRNQALFNIALDTGINAVKLFAQTVPPGILSAIAIAQGGIQAALVASQPLPQFFKGTDHSPEGLAWVGEKGRELIKDPSGALRLTGDGAELTYLNKGSKVLTNEKTEKYLNNNIGIESKILGALEKRSNFTIIPAKNKIIERKGRMHKTWINSKIR